MDASLILLIALLVIALAAALWRDRSLPLEGLRSTARLLRGIWPELILGFLLAGLLDVLIPRQQVVRWLGGEGPLWRGITIGWLAGLAVPGGPYLVFPLVAGLFRSGAAAGPLIALISAKMLLSPVRMLTYEAPLLGWPMTLARLLPGLVIPPLLGWAGHWLYQVLQRAK
jgi:uncharacterized membrane protein YraQ (UPF0718 family)